MLSGRGVTRRFGGLLALDGVDFDVQLGQLVGLIGPNGSGKSTLFNLISGLFRPTAGTLTFEGHDLARMKPHQIARAGIGRTFQIVRPFQAMTAGENVRVGVLYGDTGVPAAGVDDKAVEWLDFAGLAHRRHTPVADLTLAEKKRLEVARALSTQPRLLLLDEVFAGLNAAEVQGAIQLIYRIRDELDVTVFMIEHVLSALMETCERVIVLSYGKKIAEGTPAEVVVHPEVVRVYLGVDYAAR
jgi:branched-chain amino acid transport system ATP-binding protein